MCHIDTNRQREVEIERDYQWIMACRWSGQCGLVLSRGKRQLVEVIGKRMNMKPLQSCSDAVVAQKLQKADHSAAQSNDNF